MSLRKPLVKFEAFEKANLISSSPEKHESQPVPVEEETKEEVPEEGPQQKPRRKLKRKIQKAVILNSQLHIQLPGYKGTQKVSLSKLINCLPVKNLKQAAKRALVASGVRGSSKKKKKPKRRQPTSLFDDG